MLYMRILVIALFSVCFSVAFGQEARLAHQYFREGEYEKASIIYKKLFDKDERNDYYFERYIESLLAIEDYEACEKAVKKQIKKSPENVILYVTSGTVYERQVNIEEAEKQYAKAIDKLPKDRSHIIRLANAFIRLTKYDYAIATFEKGSKLLKDDLVFAYNLGDLYRRKGDMPLMISNFLNSLDANPSRLNNIKTIFQRSEFTEDSYQELKKQLYERIQNDSDATYFPELLAWVFMQQKEYSSALRQVSALDRRFRENGSRVMELADIASNDKDYKTAIKAYEYIVNQKGPNSSYYVQAKQSALRCKREKVVEGYNYAQEDLLDLQLEYNSFLDEFGRSKLTAPIILELARFEAFYINDLEESIRLLNELIDYPNIDPVIQAEAKLNLADFYLMKSEVWEATLLYSQVDKAFKEDILGHEARFRNAKLSYYNGDFEWAQAQFEILKSSTSKLIANDALDLSVFIMDNLGLDTTARPLQLYAEADLLVFQNRFESAFHKLDTLGTTYKDHSLEDDILYLKSKIYQKQRNFDQQAAMLQKIIESFGEEIKADNAIFELAQLYEAQLNDLEQAKALYEKLFMEYSSSTLAVEARKRFRILRGDNI